MATNYPASLDDNSSLYEATDLATSTLSADITSVATSLTLASGTLFPASGGIILIESEIIKYASRTSNTLNTLTRGYGNSTAAAHVSGKTVDLVVSADYNNNLQDAVIALETQVGVDGAETMIVIPASSVQGDTLFHNGTVYTRLVAGASGLFYKTQGASANPIWSAIQDATTSVKGIVQLAGDIGGTVTAVTVTDLTIASEARGDLLMRGASIWARFVPGTSGLFLQSAGAGADLVWAAAKAMLVTSAVTHATTTYYSGLNSYQASVTNEALVKTPVAFAGTAKNLFVSLDTAPGGANAIVVTLRKNGVNTTLTVTITGAATTGNDVSNSVAIAQGDLLSISWTPTGGTGAAAEAKASFEYQPS